MVKTQVYVPEGIKFISEWKDYKLPKFHCIVDKGVTGCGYTEFCLTNSEYVVLCSPRKLLLENKRDQHTQDPNILYLENRIENFKGAKSFKQRVKDHIENCLGPFGDAPVKFMVTYDSSNLVVDVLRELNMLDKFTFVIDEFQSIFLDAYFKADIEFDFVDNLQGCKNVLYLSATPMLDKYLDKLPEFKDLPFYEIIWPESAIEKIVIKRKQVKYLGQVCQDIINDYLSGRYPYKLFNNSLALSKEAVFFFNSISDIIRILKKTQLKPELVNIICANDPENKAKLNKLGHSIGKIPLKGEPNKMFTFCTKTSYIGADFYSDCASTYIFADPNLEHLALDISLDLPQIVGRQRDRNNPFKNDVTIFYKTTREDMKLDRKSFDKKQEKRRLRSKTLLSLFKRGTLEEKEVLLDKIISDIKVSKYAKDFVGVSEKTNTPMYNKFIEIANERAWEVSQEDYQDSINVTRAIAEAGFGLEEKEVLNEKEKIAQDFLDNHFYTTGFFHEKMRMYCEFMDKYSGDPEIEFIIYNLIKDERFRTYYRLFGTPGCSAAKYMYKPLLNKVYDLSKEDQLRQAIYTNFKAGNRLTKKDIKSKLSDIHRDLGITRKAKATDLKLYFKLKPITLYINSKSENGFELKSLV